MAKSILNLSRISGVTYAINPYVGCQHACSYCLHPSTQILTEKGFQEIQHVVHNENLPLIVTHKGRFQPIEKTFHHYYEGVIRRIQLRYYGDFSITPNHRIYAIKRNNLICVMDSFSICYPNRIDKGTNQTRKCNECTRRRKVYPKLIEASELEIGDFVIVPIPRDSNDVANICVSEVLTESEFSDLVQIDEKNYVRFKRGKTRIPNKLRLNKEFSRLAGYYVSEGCVISEPSRPNSASLIFTFHENEDLFINDVFRLLKQFFNLGPKIRAGSPKTTRVEMHSTIVARFFETLFGERSEKMKAPSWFLFLPVHKQKEFLKGAFRGDGSITENKNRPTSYVTTSPIIRDAVQLMLLRLGIPSGMSISKSGKKRKNTAYIIFPAGTFRREFVEIFELGKEVKEGHNIYVGKTRDFLLVPIKEIIEEEYLGLVYNLQVQEDRTYLANYAAISNCYARFMSRYTGHQGEEWGSFVDVKTNAPRVLQTQLRRRKKTSKDSVLFSSVTDAYQPLERRYELTRHCIELLTRHEFPISILTKSDLVVRDADLLGKSTKNEVGMTIISLKEKVRRVFEAGAPPINRRLNALAELHSQGLGTYAFVGPIIPLLSTPDLEDLIRQLGDCGVDYVLFDRLNVKYGNRPVIENALKNHFPSQAKAIREALRPGSPYYENVRTQIVELSKQYGVETDIIF